MSILEDLFLSLKDENDELQRQLTDLNYLIELREEELAELKKSSGVIAETQSKLECNLLEIEQMQNHIAIHQQQYIGAVKREASTEQELLDSIETEKAYFTIREEFESAKNAITDLHHQLKDATYLYKENIDLKSKIAELESNLELALLDNQFLKEDMQNAPTVNAQNFNEEE
jgi:predicted  nucleic acid-binding Zn-ribbon protein